MTRGTAGAIGALRSTSRASVSRLDRLPLFYEDAQDLPLHRRRDDAVHVLPGPAAVRRGRAGRGLGPLVVDPHRHTLSVDLEEELGRPALSRRGHGDLLR